MFPTLKNDFFLNLLCSEFNSENPILNTQPFKIHFNGGASFCVQFDVSLWRNPSYIWKKQLERGVLLTPKEKLNVDFKFGISFSIQNILDRFLWDFWKCSSLPGTIQSPYRHVRVLINLIQKLSPDGLAWSLCSPKFSEFCRTDCKSWVPAFDICRNFPCFVAFLSYFCSKIILNFFIFTIFGFLWIRRMQWYAVVNFAAPVTKIIYVNVSIIIQSKAWSSQSLCDSLRVL